MMEERPITGPYAKIIPKFGYDDSLWSALLSLLSALFAMDERRDPRYLFG